MNSCAIKCVIKKTFHIVLITLCLSTNMELFAHGKDSSALKKTQPQHPTNAPVEANEFMSYRGQRKSVESEDFYMLEFKTGEYAKEILLVTIIFNQAVNPKSITKESICIQNSRKYELQGISFNKEGTKVRITVKDSIEFPVNFQITNVQSYNGKNISSVSLENIFDSEAYKYDMESKEWKKF